MSSKNLFCLAYEFQVMIEVDIDDNEIRAQHSQSFECCGICDLRVVHFGTNERHVLTTESVIQIITKTQFVW